MAKQPIVWVVFSYYPVRRLGCFSFLAIVNSDCVSIYVHFVCEHE